MTTTGEFEVVGFSDNFGIPLYEGLPSVTGVFLPAMFDDIELSIPEKE